MKIKILSSFGMVVLLFTGCDINSLLSAKLEENKTIHNQDTNVDINKTLSKIQNTTMVNSNPRYFVVSYLYTKNGVLKTEQVLTERSNGTFPPKVELIEYLYEGVDEDIKNVVPINIQELSESDFLQYSAKN